MTRVEALCEEVGNTLTELNDKEVKRLNEYHYLDEFLKTFNVYDPKSYEEVTPISYLTCVLFANNIDMSFEDLMHYTVTLEEFVNYPFFDDTLYRQYLISLEKLYNLGLLDKLNDKNFNEKENEVYREYKVCSQKLFSRLNIDCKEEYHAEENKAFIELFKALPQVKELESFLDLRFILEKVQGTIGKVYNSFVNDHITIGSDENIKLKNKEKDKMFTTLFRSVINEYPNLTVNKNYEKIRKHYAAVKEEVKNEISVNNKRIRKLEDFIFKLKYINLNNVIKIENFDEYLFKPEIRYLFTEFALEHNLNLSEDIELQNRKYKNNEITKLELLFTKYGLNFNNLNEEEKKKIIAKNELEDIEPLLASLKYSDLFFLTEYHQEFTNLILLSTEERIKNIDCALKNKIIDKNFIIRNLEILFDEEKYNNFTKNLNLLTMAGIDLNILLKNNSEIFLLPNNTLLEMFEILKEYEFTFDDNNNGSILIDSNLLDIIDNFIELDLYDTLKDNQKVLNSNNSKNVIKRILICNLLGINPVNASLKLIGQVTTGNKFYLSPDKYDNYIIDSQNMYLNPVCVKALEHQPRTIISEDTKNNKLIETLDEFYKRDELTYEINDIVISRNRVLRNFEVLKEIKNISTTDLLYQSILYKMIENIEDEKLIEIYNSIKLLNLENNKIYKK